MRGVVHIFEAQGLDTARLFEQAGIDIRRLRQPHERFASAEINRLWSMAVAVSGHRTLGLDRQLVSRHFNFDIAAQAMWPGPLLRDGLQSLARYLALIGDSSGFELTPVLEGTWLQLARPPQPDTPRQRVEFGVLTMLMLCRRVTHKPVRALAIEFTFPDPPDLHPYLMAFASPLRFNQPATRMLLDAEHLGLPLAISHQSLFALHEQVIEDRLARARKATAVWRASAEIIHRIHLGEPTPREIARALGIGEEALRKNLKAERTTYEAVLQDVRHELASHLLASADFSLARIPSLLGYSSATGFNHDCKQWFGVTPAQYRQLLAAAAS